MYKSSAVVEVGDRLATMRENMIIKLRFAFNGGFVVVVVFYCPYAQSVSCSEDINVETDECKHFSVVTIDVETL